MASTDSLAYSFSHSASIRVSTLCQALGIQQRKRPPAWNLGSSGGQDDGGGGDRQGKGTFSTADCDVRCGKTTKQGKWVLEQREGIPIIVHIYTHEIYRIQANCVRGLCFPMPLFGGLLQRAGQKGDEGGAPGGGHSLCKAGSFWSRRQPWDPGRDGQTLGPGRGGLGEGLQMRRVLNLPIWVLGWLPGRRDGRAKGSLRTPTVCNLDAWVLLRRVPRSSLGRGGGQEGSLPGRCNLGSDPRLSIPPRSPGPL